MLELHKIIRVSHVVACVFFILLYDRVQQGEVLTCEK